MPRDLGQKLQTEWPPGIGVQPVSLFHQLQILNQVDIALHAPMHVQPCPYWCSTLHMKMFHVAMLAQSCRLLEPVPIKSVVAWIFILWHVTPVSKCPPCGDTEGLHTFFAAMASIMIQGVITTPAASFSHPSYIVFCCWFLCGSSCGVWIWGLFVTHRKKTRHAKSKKQRQSHEHLRRTWGCVLVAARQWSQRCQATDAYKICKTWCFLQRMPPGSCAPSNAAAVVLNIPSKAIKDLSLLHKNLLVPISAGCKAPAIAAKRINAAW